MNEVKQLNISFFTEYTIGQPLYIVENDEIVDVGFLAGFTEMQITGVGVFYKYLVENSKGERLALGSDCVKPRLESKKKN